MILLICDWESHYLVRGISALIITMRWIHMGSISWDAFARATKMGFIRIYTILSFDMYALLG